MTQRRPYRVNARVRLDGSASPYSDRDFELMLEPGPREHLHKQARTLLRQIGYEPRIVGAILPKDPA